MQGIGPGNPGGVNEGMQQKVTGFPPRQPQTPDPSQRPPTHEPTGKPGDLQPGMMQLVMRGKAMTLQMGQILRAQVHQEHGEFKYTLRFGDKFATALSQTPLTVGEFIQAKVSGNDKGNVTLQILRQEMFSKMEEGDVANQLMGMKMPVNPKNLSLAKGMIEQGVPLSQKDFGELQQALSRLPDPQQQDVSSAAFLKASNLPLTPQNITSLTNFIMQNPMFGAQLMEVSTGLRKLAKEIDTKKGPRDLADLVARLPGIMGELALNPKTPGRRKPSQNMHQMAFQAGIERAGPHFQDEEAWDLVKLMRELREQLPAVAPYAIAELLEEMEQMLIAVEENFTAQKLFNRAEAEKWAGLYYLQVPIQYREQSLTAEVRIGFERDKSGEPKVDPDNTRVEIAVHTDDLGQVSYLLEFQGGSTRVRVAVDDEAVQAHMEHLLPFLEERILRLGYIVHEMVCQVKEDEQSPITPLMPQQKFDTIERINILT